MTSTPSLAPARSRALPALPPSPASPPAAPGADHPGAVTDPRWARPAYGVLLLGTALLYLWHLGDSHWANSFYSAAVQAGSESWKAFFFGSSDAANAITVDKTPLSLWPMALSVRIFGLSGWSILVPQALMGVATVALVHRTVRRTTGSAAAGLLAGTVLALTPVAALMFRFNNPDAMLVLLLTGAVMATLRAVEESADDAGRPLRWLMLGGALVGLGFLTKMLQAFLVLPVLALVYLVCARTPLGRRIGHLLAAFATMILAGGWWIAIVEAWPAASRPYIGGSQHNSILELTFGYNGFGRLNGNETGSVGGNGPAGSHWGATGLGRMFNAEIGGQIAWLLPAALVLGVGAGWLARREVRIRAALMAWGGVLLVTAITFSFMAGIFHAYYTVALAPAIAVVVAIGSHALWRRRRTAAARVVLALAGAVTTATAFVLLGRSSDFMPWLRPLVVVVGLVAAAGLLGVHRTARRTASVVVAAAVVAALAGPAAYAVQTAGSPHTGSIPSAGPTTGGVGGPGRPGPGGAGGRGGPIGGFGARPPQGQVPGQAPGQGGFGGQGGPAGGLLDASTPTSAVVDLLTAHAADYTWVAAAIGSNTASGYQLATEDPVLAVGGFNGSDPSPTLAEFQRYVAAGRIHYFIGGGTAGGPGLGSGTSAQISAWVQANYSATTLDGVAFYDLTSPTTASAATAASGDAG